MRSIIIGDIHGCDRPLRALLNDLHADPASDRLILLGDLFDRGPDSWEVYQTVRGLSDAFGPRFVLLRGNHEDYLMQTEPLTLMQRMVWKRVGRDATVRSFRRHGERMEDAAGWLRGHTGMFFVGESFQCVHAGLKISPLELNDTQTMIFDHEVVLRNRYAGPLTITGHIGLAEPVWFAGDGKTAVKLPYGKRQALPDHGVICIDTGCGKGGRLTAMAVEAGGYCLYGKKSGI